MSAGAELHLLVRPIDTLMFRDGRPFNQGDPGAADAVSVFPPFPPTVVGMVRALLARGIGWDGRSGWSKPIVDALGHGVNWQGEANALAPLTVSAAVVCREGEDGLALEALYPVPRSLLAADDGTLARLVPGSSPVTCDLGEVRLPTPETGGEGLKESGKWLTTAGLKAVLDGALPRQDDVVAQTCLWDREPRVGVGIDIAGVGSDGLPISRLAERRPVDGALYAATHTRVRKNVALAVKVSTSNPQGLVLEGVHLGAVGGEHRMAEIASVACDKFPERPAAPKQLQSEGGLVRYVVYHASPCLLSPLPKARAALDDTLPGEVVSACLGKAQTIGGWDSQERRPIPMRPAIPAGSVWFLEAPAGDEAKIIARHGGSIGQAQAWGFGQIFIGTW